MLPYNSKQVKQINPITNKFVVFDTLSDVNIQLGFTNDVIKYAIENKTLCGGCKWEYA